MTKPDRFEQVVADVIDPRTHMVPPRLVVDLLRKQHTAMVRKVRRMKVPYKFKVSGAYDFGYCRACDDFLACLKGGK